MKILKLFLYNSTVDSEIMLPGIWVKDFSLQSTIPFSQLHEWGHNCSAAHTESKKEEDIKIKKGNII